MRISDWSSDVCSSDLRIPSKAYRESGACLFIGTEAIDDFLAIGTGALDPFGQHGFTDFIQTLHEFIGGLDDFHAVLAQVVQIPLGFFFGDFPAALLGVLAGLEQGLLAFIVKLIEGLLVYDDGILG